MVVLIIIILLGQLFYTHLMASITACMTNQDAPRARFTEKMSKARTYMISQQLDAKLVHNVTQYFEYLWLRTNGVEPTSMFDCLPPALWASVSFDLYEDLVRSSNLFAMLSSLEGN